MRYLGQDELTQVMGIGAVGEVRAGPDGHLYQWVQGVDGLGNPIGFWRGLKRLAKRARSFVRQALPIAQQFAPFIPGGAAVAAGLRFATPLLRQARSFARQALPVAQQFAPFVPGVGPAVAAGLTTASPWLRQAGLVGHDGLGALYQAPDGRVYQTAGVAQEEELRGLGQDELTQVMGIGAVGEVRAGPDGHLYQWVQGVDGLGNPIGFWRGLRRLAQRARSFARRALPIVQQFAPFVPGVGPAVAAGLTTASPFLRQAGLVGAGGLGALYQAPDGSLYQVQGMEEEEELQGLAEDEELRGFAEDEELRGLGALYQAPDGSLYQVQGMEEDEELRGLAEDEELRGFAEEEELRGFAEEEDLRGMDGYVRQNDISGVEAYVPQQPPQTRWFVPPAQAPEMWKPLW